MKVSGNPQARAAEQADFIIIGSGAAGLSAAISAAALGARVVVLEKTGFIGGTTAFSGALLWAPLHNKRNADDPPDTREQAIEYICRNSGACERQLAEAYVDSAAETLGFLERTTPLKLVSVDYPDTFPEGHGGVSRGRHVEPAMHSLRIAGRWRERLRRSPHLQPMTSGEATQWGLLRDMRKGLRRAAPTIALRLLRAQRAGGQALIAALLRGALDLGVTFRLDYRAVNLRRDTAGRVIAVDCETGGRHCRLGAAKGIVLACGGFEWSAKHVEAHVTVPLEHLPSPPLAEGDNLRLAESAGAKLARLDEIWHWPTGFIPGTSYEGREIGRLVLADRSMPHSIVVNRQGRRFADEAAHNFALAMLARDAEGNLLNTPAWVVFDQQYRDRYPILLKVLPGARNPEWLASAPRLADLARQVGIDPTGLRATVERFNSFVHAGRDGDFNRGGTAYDRYFGDSRNPRNPCLGTLEQPPFYALRVYPSAVGTRGGAKTTADGQVIDENGIPIPSLYAAGNASACFHGPMMVAGGATIMAAMTFGRRAALHAWHAII